MSACPHQASGQPIACLLAEPDTASCFGSFGFTTFINGSLTLTNQLSLAPHPGATPELTRDPSRDHTYPARWLHCQSAQHPTVAGDAPLLDYRGLNPWIGHPARNADQLLVQPSLHRMNRTKPIQLWAALHDPGPVTLGLCVPSRPGTYATRVARLGSQGNTDIRYPPACRKAGRIVSTGTGPRNLRPGPAHPDQKGMRSAALSRVSSSSSAPMTALRSMLSWTDRPRRPTAPRLTLA